MQRNIEESKQLKFSYKKVKNEIQEKANSG
jgi:hypothetical protein